MVDAKGDSQATDQPRIGAVSGQAQRPREDDSQPEARNTVESNGELFERIDSLYRERTSGWRRLLRRLCGWR